jgi:alpha-beta hydrolase superfamily lysophospholipase
VDELRFRTDDDVEVFYRRWLPDRAPRLVLLVAHGMSEHSGRYARVAAALVADDIAVYALDHRGHGHTAASTGKGRTGAAGIYGLLDDLHRLRETARGDVGSVPVVLFGHSMGALVALAYAERHGRGLVGLVLSGSPGVDDNMRAGAEALQAMVDSGSADDPVGALAGFNAAFEPARTPYDWLSRDAAEVDAYIADSLSGDDVPMTYGFLASLFAMVADEIEPANIASIPSSIPVLLLTGEADPVSNGGANVRELEARMQAAGLAVDAIYYPDARHEILNEINRNEVEADLVAWLSKLPPSS